MMVILEDIMQLPGHQDFLYNHANGDFGSSIIFMSCGCALVISQNCQDKGPILFLRQCHR